LSAGEIKVKLLKYVRYIWLLFGVVLFIAIQIVDKYGEELHQIFSKVVSFYILGVFVIIFLSAGLHIYHTIKKS
jgi:hypothetical protein